MDERPYIPHDLERMVQGALRELVGDAEPSPAVWRGIRERIVAGRSRQRAAGATACRMRSLLQAAAACAAVVAIGLGVRLSSDLPLLQMPSQRDVVVTVTERRGGIMGSEDALSGRLVWLAAREAAPKEEVRVGGVRE